MIDLHIHILPGLDDGPATMEEALAMCAIAVADGTTVAVATPHMPAGPRREEVLAAVAELNETAQAAGMELRIVPGADVHVGPELARQVRERRVVTVGDAGKYLLVELPQDVLPAGLGQILFEVQLLGVTPIITHPERNLEIQREVERAAELAGQGNLLQLTAASIVGDFGREAEQCARQLLERGMGHLVASDAHSPHRRRPGLSRARAAVAGLLGTEAADEIFIRRPRAILAGAAVEAGEPRAEPRRRGLLGRLERVVARR